VLRACRRVVRRPRSDPSALVAGALEQAGAVRLGWRRGTAASWWALLNWAADVGCLLCALLAVGAPVPWQQLLLIWCAGAGAASFCPVPAGLGVVDIVLISALAATGLPAPRAVAVVLLYRIITFKIAVTSVWLIGHHISVRRQGPHLASSPAGGTAGTDGGARAR
jgi:putative heme transporter